MKKFTPLLLLLTLTSLLAKTIIVDHKFNGVNSSNLCMQGDSYYSTINSALFNAEDGDIINICPGTYNESIIINKKDLTIRGVGKNIDDVVIDSNGYTIKIASASNSNMVMEHFRLRKRGESSEAAIWADENSNNKIILRDLVVESDGIGLQFQNGFSCSKNITIRSKNRGIDIGTPKSTIFIDGFDINSSEAEGIVIGYDEDIGVNIRNSIILAKKNGIHIDKASNVLIDSVCVTSKEKRGIYLPANALNPVIKNSIVSSDSVDEWALLLEVSEKGVPQIINNCFYGKHQVKATNANSYFYGNFFDNIEDSNNDGVNLSDDSEKIETQHESLSYIEESNPSSSCQNRCRIEDIEYTCPNSESYSLNDKNTGPFDAWDDYNILRGVFDRNISTKIAGKRFNLTIASINRYNSGIETKENIDIKFRLYDKSRSKYLGNSWIDFNASVAADGPTIQHSFTIEESHKEVVVRFRVCASHDDDLLFNLYPFNECEIDHDQSNEKIKLCNEIDDYKHDEKGLCEFESSDSFAIRPNSFQVDNPNQKYIKAGNFTIIMKAVNEKNSSIKDYNASISSLNIQPILYDQNKTNAQCDSNGSIEIVKDSQKFLNGEMNATLKFSETGLFKFRVSEKDGEEWAYVDRDDTEDLIRYIQPSDGEIKFAFIPYKFETNATYKTTNGKDWVYMYTLPKSSIPKISTYIDYTVVAKNRDGNVTRNFTDRCFSDENYEYRTTFDLLLTSKIDSSSEINISQYDENNYTNYSLERGKNSINSLIKSSQFSNGIGKVKIYFNIDRDKTKAVPPVSITLLEVNSSNTSPTYKDIYFIGKKDINQSKKFFYGRVFAPNYRLSSESNKTDLYAEIYCGVPASTVCPSKYKTSIYDEAWKINKDHSINDGNIDKLISFRSEVSTTSKNIIFSNGIAQPTIEYNGLKGYPFSTRVELFLDSWLLYNRYDKNANSISYVVEFYGNKKSSKSNKNSTDTHYGWVGKGYGAGLHVDENVSKIPNKRINW